MVKKKAMGLWSATSIGIGAMVGAGIFSIFGTATKISGSAVYLSFIIAGLMALLSVYSYAKLGVKYPSAGGPSEFIIRGFGDSVLSGGFNILLWISYIFALALYAKAFGIYFMTFFPNISSAFITNLVATGIIILFTGINFIGAKAVGKSEFSIVAIKVGILMLFALAGSFFIKPVLISHSTSVPFSNVIFGAGIVFLAYQGFGLITNTAEDIKNPKKNIPKALFYSVLIVMAIYILISLVVVGNLSLAAIAKAQDYTLAEAAKPFLGLLGFKIMAVAALFSTASAINASLYGGANVSYLIAKHGELPQFFERKIWHRGTEGLFITAALVIFFTNFLNLEGIGMLGSASLLMIYIAVHIAHLKLRKHTKAKSSIIYAALISSILFLGVLTLYEIQNSIVTLWVLLIVTMACFIAEWAYRTITNRSLRARANPQILED